MGFKGHGLEFAELFPRALPTWTLKAGKVLTCLAPPLLCSWLGGSKNKIQIQVGLVWASRVPLALRPELLFLMREPNSWQCTEIQLYKLVFYFLDAFRVPGRAPGAPAGAAGKHHPFRARVLLAQVGSLLAQEVPRIKSLSDIDWFEPPEIPGPNVMMLSKHSFMKIVSSESETFLAQMQWICIWIHVWKLSIWSPRVPWAKCGNFE